MSFQARLEASDMEGDATVFKRLRNQFIIMHMGVVMLIVLLFFGAVLFFANQGINSSINALGRSPITTMGSERPNIRSPLAFSVIITSNGGVVNVASPFAMSEDFYTNAVNQAISKKADIGRIKVEGVNLGYRTNENHISFIDITREVEMFNRLVWTFLWIALPLLFLIYLSSLYFAKRSIQPIESAFVKQKEFVADASHELKTPIATISTNADVLFATSDKNTKKWITHIKTETTRMAGLVESLLYLAKIDYEDKPQFAPIDLGEVLNDVILPLEAVIHEKNVDLQVNCAESVMMKGDMVQIHRLLGILIDNAIKYTSGEISVNIENLGSQAQITVKNSGGAIPPQKLDKLFDRFYRADESHQYTGGFGLGLSIAKAIVERHKGEITCSSSEEDGTRFKVVFRHIN